jgi:hypothetical protein
MIHRDLAVRNIMLKTGPGGVLVAQLADLGMSRELGEEGTYGVHYTRAKLPLQHCAPQLLEKEVGQKETMNADATTDVWAMGVTMFEMVTDCSGGRSKGPYLEEGTIRKTKMQKVTSADGKEFEVEATATYLASNTEIRTFIGSKKNKETGKMTVPGGRLHIPAECPAALRILMQAMWSKNGSGRPTAVQCIAFLLEACAPILEEARAWENDAESATKMKQWLVDDIGIPLPRPLDMFGMFNYECLVDDDNLRDDIKSELGDAGSDFVLGETFKALHREIKALKWLNVAVEQEPLKGTLAKACEDAKKEEGHAQMQEKLMAKFTAKRAKEKVANDAREEEVKAGEEKTEAAEAEAAAAAEAERVQNEKDAAAAVAEEKEVDAGKEKVEA